MRTLSAIAVFLRDKCGVEDATRESVLRTAQRLHWVVKNSRVKDSDWMGCDVREFQNDIIEIKMRNPEYVIPTSRFDYEIRDPRNPLSLGL